MKMHGLSYIEIILLCSHVKRQKDAGDFCMTHDRFLSGNIVSQLYWLSVMGFIVEWANKILVRPTW